MQPNMAASRRQLRYFLLTQNIFCLHRDACRQGPHVLRDDVNLLSLYIGKYTNHNHHFGIALLQKGLSAIAPSALLRNVNKVVICRSVTCVY